MIISNTNAFIFGGTMEQIVFLLQILKNYILENDLNIDKATYYTIVIGQITIYGILLTFYQFVASYQGNKKAVTKYLGINITEYFVKKNMKVFTKIVSKRFFGIMLVLEILYKPFITVYGNIFKVEKINIMNFFWYAFAIIYFVLFVILFFQCTISILTIKLSSDAKMNGFLINDINKNFLKKTLKERVSHKNVELLCQDLKYLCNAIQYDENPELQERYNHLISIIFTDYMRRKQYEIDNIEKRGKIFKNQVNWKYNANCEVRLLQDIIDEKYFQLDEENKKYILEFYIDLLKLNLLRAELAGYNKICCNRYDYISLKVVKNIYYVSEWEEVILKIYQIIDDEKRQALLQQFINSDLEMNLYLFFCKDCIKELIRKEIDSVFDGKREQKDFVKLFGEIVKNKQINDFYTELLRDRILDYDRYDATEMICLLSEQNCTYLFTYIAMYYCLYSYSFEWEFFNITILRELWKHHGNMQDNAEVIKKIKDSNIGHRFKQRMYTKFVEYIDARGDDKLFKTIYDEKILDVFCIWVIKTCVTNQNDILYSGYPESVDLNAQIAIINELSKHDEVLECKSIIKWIEYMRYNIFKNKNSFSLKFDTSFRYLLLTSINAEVIVNCLNENCYYYINCIGMYILVKLHELSNQVQELKKVKDVVKKAFIASNMNIDDYIDMLARECSICICEINFVQKENMKRYLMKIL